MPCWYFERKDIKNSPSIRDGIDINTENRYRREGARFILDAGTKMMLRYDTCATGVAYFHRFYVYHSFKDFYRYLTAACCLFLAGKVEETPKKCKDIIKTAQTLMSPAAFQRFGEDPREEVIMMERVLLKTIKFDLQVEHPYVYMLKNAKLFKASDKEKTQKMAQMAWTFINDSLCTTLCLQWEPEIIAVSLMYLASRLTKFEPSDWSGRTSSKSKWWEDFIEGMTLELMEDICHQVLDLYSNKQAKKGLEGGDSPIHTPKRAEDSPPPPPPPDRTPKRSREVTPSEGDGVVSKAAKYDRDAKSGSAKSSSSAKSANTTVGAPIQITTRISGNSNTSKKQAAKLSGAAYSDNPPPHHMPPTSDFSSFNPYVSSQMFSSSFMSQEGSQNIQSILAGSPAPPPPTGAPGSAYHMSADPNSGASVPYLHPPPMAPHGDVSYSYLPPPPSVPSYTAPPHHTYPVSSSVPPPTAPPPGFEPYPPPSMSSYGPPSYPPSGTHGSAYHPPPASYSALPPSQQSYGGGYQPPSSSYPPSTVPPPNIPPPQIPPPLSSGRDSSYPYSSSSQHPPPQSGYPGGSGHLSRQHRGYHQQHPKPGGRDRKDIPALTEIKITGRPDWSQGN